MKLMVWLSKTLNNFIIITYFTKVISHMMSVNIYIIVKTHFSEYVKVKDLF